MTSRRFLQLARRFWVVVLLGFVTAGTMALATTPETVFWVTQPLTVVQPQTMQKVTTLEDLPPTVVPAAMVLMQLVNGQTASLRSNSADATLYGEGRRDAVTARLRDFGGQWGVAIPDPIIDIQVVGSSPKEVVAKLGAKTDRLNATLSALQTRLHVNPSQRLVIQPPRVAPTVVEVSGSKTRARAATVLIVLLATGTVIFAFDRLPSGRTRRGLPWLPPLRRRAR